MSPAQQILQSPERLKRMADIAAAQEAAHWHLMYMGFGVLILVGLFLFGINRGWNFLKEMRERRGEWQ